MRLERPIGLPEPMAGAEYRRRQVPGSPGDGAMGPIRRFGTARGGMIGTGRKPICGKTREAIRPGSVAEV